MEGESEVDIGTWIWKGFASLALITCSGLFSGLTLGLLGQDITQLHVYAASGSESEQRNAKKMLPVRKRVCMHGCYSSASRGVGNSGCGGSVQSVGMTKCYHAQSW